MALAPNSRVGSYLVVDKLGAGGMGVVWRALDTRLDREVALKFLPESATADPMRLERLVQEGRVGGPFVTAGQTQSVFRFPLTERAGGAGGWFVKLGAIGRAPQHENLTHRYEFALGIEVTSRGVTRSFGEDPEFDIGL